MDRIVECTPEGVARLYFLDLAGWVKDLHAARESVCRVLSSLLEEFSTVFPRSRLQLSPKNRPLHGPTALYWAEIAAVRVKSKSGASELRRVPKHLKGFHADWAFTKAKRSDRRDRLVDFNRRREALNAASRAVMSALDHLRKATLRRFPPKSAADGIKSCLDPYTVIELPSLPAEFFPAGLPPRLSQCLRSGWTPAFSLALAEHEVCDLAREVSGNPSVDGLRLDLSERKPPNLLRSTRWIFTPSGGTYPKLTDRLMRELHLREGVRPVLSMKERKRRRIEKALARSAGTLDSIRKTCEAAQLVVTAKLAEAKRILVPDASLARIATPRVAG